MRLFVAIELSEEVRGALVEAQQALRVWSKTVRWVEPKLLHLTVKFLGDVPDGDLPRIVEAVEGVANAANPFEWRLTGCGCFPPRGGVRIVWVGAEDASGNLAELVKSAEAGFEALGFSRESRPFSPHLTIGRVREDVSGGKLRAAVETTTIRPVSQQVKSVTLMSSVLSPQGPRYAAVHRAALGAGH